MKNLILKLKNGKDYYIIEEILHNNKKYALATEYNSEKNIINEEELVIMEVKVIDKDLIVDEIHDDKIAEEVSIAFTEKLQKKNEKNK